MQFFYSYIQYLIEAEDMESESFEEDRFNFMESPFLNIHLESQDHSDSDKELPLRLSE